MKVFTIEIAEAIENELKGFLKDWGGGYAMRFTRFLDLGGKQCDLYVYPAPEGAPPWLIVRIKSVYKSEQGECMQYFVSIPEAGKSMDDVLVSPEVWKLPALSDKILTFVKNDMLVKINEGGGALESGSGAETGGTLGAASGGPEEEEDEDLDDIDTSGILAGDGGADMDFDPMDIINSANEDEGGGDDGGDAAFNPEDVIKD
ncbi:MAG: hypothetical protein AAGB46_17365 [Verrucomicrobiota bacterium]